IHLYAQAHRLTGEFYLSCGMSQEAQLHLKAACDGFMEWGAAVPARKIRDRFALKEPSDNKSSLNNTHLDYVSLLKASHTLSVEIDLHKLLEKLMLIVMENAGAQKAVL